MTDLEENPQHYIKTKERNLERCPNNSDSQHTWTLMNDTLLFVCVSCGLRGSEENTPKIIPYVRRHRRGRHLYQKKNGKVESAITALPYETLDESMRNIFGT